ncbi:hypothetical protein [Vibrio pomeroyi]
MKSNISEELGLGLLSLTLEQQQEVAKLCDVGMCFKEALNKVKGI